MICLILADTLLIKSSAFCFILAAFLCGYPAALSTMPYGICSTIAAFLLGIIISPFKLHCLTFLGLAVFVLICQYLMKRSRTEKAFGKTATVIIIVAAWNVFIITAVVLYSILIGNIMDLTSGTVMENFPFPVIVIIAVIVLEALGPVIYIAYGQFINFMDRLVKLKSS